MEPFSQDELATLRVVDKARDGAYNRAKRGASAEPGPLSVNPEALQSKPIPFVINSGEAARGENREKSLGEKVARAHKEQAMLLIASALWWKYFGLIGRTALAYGAVGCLIFTRQFRIFRNWQVGLSAHIDAFISVPSTV